MWFEICFWWCWKTHRFVLMFKNTDPDVKTYGFWLIVTVYKWRRRNPHTLGGSENGIPEVREVDKRRVVCELEGWVCPWTCRRTIEVTGSQCVIGDGVKPRRTRVNPQDTRHTNNIFFPSTCVDRSWIILRYNPNGNSKVRRSSGDFFLFITKGRSKENIHRWVSV
jgi:hypothetical protein